MSPPGYHLVHYNKKSGLVRVCGLLDNYPEIEKNIIASMLKKKVTSYLSKKEKKK